MLFFFLTMDLKNSTYNSSESLLSVLSSCLKFRQWGPRQLALLYPGSLRCGEGSTPSHP